MNFADTHCHLNLEHFDTDRPDALARARAHGVSRILIPALTLESSREIVTLCESTPELYAAIGVHPNDALTWEAGTRDALRDLATHPRVKAIGEIGLDYYWDAAPEHVQKDVLWQQLELAAETGKPVVLHSRDKGNALDGPCIRDLLDMLAEWVSALQRAGNPLAATPGVLHSFSGSLEHARRAIELGLYIGVTGPVTFRNARQRQEIVAALPLDKLLIETDAPFLAPHPHRGQRNEPAYVTLVAGKIASLHHRSLETVAETTSANAEKLFSWRA